MHISSVGSHNNFIERNLKATKSQAIISHIETLLTLPEAKPQELSAEQKELLTRLLSKKNDIRNRLQEVALQKLTSPQQKLRQWRDTEVYISLLRSQCTSFEDQRCWDSIMEKIKTAINLLPDPGMAIWKSPVEKVEALIIAAIPPETRLPDTQSQLNSRKATPIDDKTFASIHAEALIKGSS